MTPRDPNPQLDNQMRFIGVDLAWGKNGRTGLCVAQAERVIDSVLVATDEEILAWLEPHVSGPCIVAIDAPLIVKNETGRRPCERIVSSCFGRYYAGAHSSNLSLAAFRDGVRGERIAEALNLNLNPIFSPREEVQRAIEVYPHPAMIALFGLDRILLYKGKRRRDLGVRRGAFLALLAHLEGLRSADPPFDVGASPRWTALRTGVEQALAPAELDRIEDELDAYVCAYVAEYYWTHGSAKCRVIGDMETGYIVTPVTRELAQCVDKAPREPTAPLATSSSARLGLIRTSMEDIAPLTVLKARELWLREAAHFTPWLFDHAEYLSEALEMDIEMQQMEVNVGTFKLDILAREVGSGRVIVIENQLGGTDHSHLGQLLTYAAGLEAHYVVWISTEMRLEHRSAFEWLNDHTEEDVGFFGLQLEALRIGDSPPAVRLNAVVKPDTWSKASRAPGNTTPRQQLYLEYWSGMLDAIHERYPGWTKSRAPNKGSWIELPAGRSGIFYALVFAADSRIRAELYVDPYDAQLREVAFRSLAEKKEDIEAAFGAPLSWEPLETKRASRIAVYSDGHVEDREQWPEFREWMLVNVGRLRDVLQPYVDALQ